MSFFSGAASCVSLSVLIVDLLLASKNNKHEFRSLKSAVDNISRVFLTALPQEGITQQGNEVLRQLHSQLLEVHNLLGKVAAMGPLVSLLKANIMREEFLRTNRGLQLLLDTFGILARGEQLLRGVAVGVALQDQGAALKNQGAALQDQAQRLAEITRDLKSCRSEFFTEEQAAHSRLLDVAATGKERVWPEELLQHRLLNELKAMPQVSGLDDDVLLSEFKALQMLALYNGPAGAEDSTFEDDITSAKQDKKCKHVDEGLEEFLLQQVCTALAASVAATSSEPLMTGPDPPADSAGGSGPVMRGSEDVAATEYLCPISQQVMINPVLLHETGHSYEAANINRWLDMHNKCPLTGQQLHSKQLSSNCALKNLIADWAAAHGIVLPAAPTYTPAPAFAGKAPAVTASAAAAASSSLPHTVLNMPHLEVNNSISREFQFADQQQELSGDMSHNPGKDPAFAGTSLAPTCRADSKQGMLRCTRTRWAVALLALVVVLGVAVGAGVGVATKQAESPTAAPGVSPPPSPAPSPARSPAPNSTNASPSPSPLPVPPVVSDGNTTSPGSANHSQARARCLGEGGDLFSPYTAEENKWLVNRSTGLGELVADDCLGLWIGLGPRDGLPSNNSASFACYKTGQTPGLDNGYPRSPWVEGEPNNADDQSGPQQQGVCAQLMSRHLVVGLPTVLIGLLLLGAGMISSAGLSSHCLRGLEEVAAL